MKRIGNLYDSICSWENLLLAEKKAMKGKLKQYGVIKHLKNRVHNLKLIQLELLTESYKIGEYTIFKIYEPKERVISRLSFNHRIVQHAIMNILEPIWVRLFTSNTYSCIKGRGIHLAANNLKKVIKKEHPKYALKFDIKKFYPSVDNNILKQIIRKKIKDVRVLNLLDIIIDSCKGIPLGNYTSQFFGNLYLTYFDHWLKETLKIRHVFKYCDDIVILHDDKSYLHNTLFQIRNYLHSLKLEIKSNYQIFPIESRGIDFLGYVFYQNHILIRKSIKLNYIRALRKNKLKSIPSLEGWLIHCNSKNLIKTYGSNTKFS